MMPHFGMNGAVGDFDAVDDNGRAIPDHLSVPPDGVNGMERRQSTLYWLAISAAPANRA